MFWRQENHCSIINRTSSRSIQFPTHNKKSALVFFFPKGQTHEDEILVKGENRTILIAAAKWNNCLGFYIWTLKTLIKFFIFFSQHLIILYALCSCKYLILSLIPLPQFSALDSPAWFPFCLPYCWIKFTRLDRKQPTVERQRETERDRERGQML